MAAARLVAPNADIVSKAHALMVNCSAAKGLQSVLKTNLGMRCVTIYVWWCWVRWRSVGGWVGVGGGAMTFGGLHHSTHLN